MSFLACILFGLGFVFRFESVSDAYDLWVDQHSQQTPGDHQTVHFSACIVITLYHHVPYNREASFHKEFHTHISKGNFHFSIFQPLLVDVLDFKELSRARMKNTELIGKYFDGLGRPNRLIVTVPGTLGDG